MKHETTYEVVFGTTGVEGELATFNSYKECREFVRDNLFSGVWYQINKVIIMNIGVKR